MVKKLKKYLKNLNICLFHLVWIVFIFFVSFNFSDAQDANNLNFIFKKIEYKIEQENIPSNLNVKISSLSETKILGMGLIKFYQLFISTQDKPSCIFSLSCSHFGMKAIKQRGFLMGTLLTADRLTRCNYLARSYYKIDSIDQTAIDLVPLYEFDEKDR